MRDIIRYYTDAVNTEICKLFDMCVKETYDNNI